MKIAVTTLACCVAALLALGMVMLYSSSMSQVGAHYLMMQLLWCALGLGLCVTASSLDYRLLKKFAWPVFIVAVLLLALVLEKHLGVVRGNARRWFSFGGVSFQPSEFAKLALIVILAWYGERYQRQMHTWVRGILLPGLLIVPVLLLIFVEPDRGTTILLAAVGGAMLLIGGVRWKYFVPPILLGVIALGVSLWHDPMRIKRIFGWLYLEEHKAGVGYQAYQAMLALGAGGWTGLGLGNSRQKLGFVPEHHTDFIFSVIGEELGLIATMSVVVAFVLIVICGICIALNARDTFGLLLGSGITFMIGLQAFINI
ncbi:MAG: putative peptidoglycan glycosyltransferase FtsW, partial [Verrucomicrobiota bacterium]